MSQRATEKQRRSTVYRRLIVLELRALRRTCPLSSRFFQLWKAMLERTSIEEGVSTTEIAAAFYPDTYQQNYDRALYLARALIRMFQRWRRNKVVVLKSTKNMKDGHWYYWNLQKIKQYEPVAEHKQEIADGLADADRRDLEIIRLNPRRRRRLAEILLEEESLRYGYP